MSNEHDNDTIIKTKQMFCSFLAEYPRQEL